MTGKFIGEPIDPVASTFDTARMAAGEPGLPGEFIWHGRIIRVTAVRRSWKETGPCRHGSDEQYVRKHWYEIDTVEDGVLKIYFERTSRGKRPTARWRIFCQTPIE